ncbi:helix-turn-helix domain-containing protein [Nocardia sp. 2]|uniref:Helix-turn-helix domain-containing protein n=1 Tax=Nocardia acididurans TaxID=2802282 RepID=A0ABS1M3W7_9NOCA|nr:helix-turn-helix domain-containing protein [Nocardia acididurans]MBL1074484.1 helix-turn-helix domain-containing protein [Nocardia acididurans]
MTRLLARLGDIAQSVFQAGLRTVPETAELPYEHFAEEVLPHMVSGFVSFLRVIEERRPVTAEEVAEFVVPVVERNAEDRIPLRLLLISVFGGARQGWLEMASEARPEDLEELITLGSYALELLMHLTVTMAEVHADVGETVYTVERESRRALCTALLRGAPADDLAARADLALEDEYDVLAIHARTGPLVPVADTLAARRRLRLVHRALADRTGTAPLHTFDGSTGIALLPTGSGEPYDDLAATFAQQFGLDVHLAEYSAVARADLPAAARHVTDLADLARLLGRPSGVYRLDDLLLEYQLTRPGPARDRLSERIAPILGHPHLFEALDAHIRLGSDRKAAAAILHVHPNTHSYRLRRVADLTGLDPSDPHDSRLLAAALTVHRLYPAAPEPAPDHAESA